MIEGSELERGVIRAVIRRAPFRNPQVKLNVIPAGA